MDLVFSLNYDKRRIETLRRSERQDLAMRAVKLSF